MYQTGSLVLSDRKRDNHFSEEVWGEMALPYATSIDRLSVNTWDSIVDGAWEIAQEMINAGSRSASHSQDHAAYAPDEAELLVDAGEDVEDDGAVDWDAASQCEYPKLSCIPY
jgi:hypothetical protein